MSLALRAPTDHLTDVQRVNLLEHARERTVGLVDAVILDELIRIVEARIPADASEERSQQRKGRRCKG